MDVSTQVKQRARLYQSMADLHFGDDYDQPPYEGEITPYLVCTAPRSGSNLFCDLLAASGCLGVPGEYFLPAELALRVQHYGIPQQRGKVDMGRYVAELKRRRTTPNGVFGAKFEYWFFEPLLKHRVVSQLFPGARYVYLKRRDLLAQAVSLSIAHQTGAWRTSLERKAEPVYDAKQIQSAMAYLQTQWAGWERLFALTGTTPLAVDYEAVLDDPDREGKRVCAFLGVETDHVFTLAKSRIKKQGTDLNKEWIARIRNDVRL